MSGTQRQTRNSIGVALLVLLSSIDGAIAGGGADVTQFTPQAGCFAETTQPLPVPTKCRKGVDSLPCIDTFRRGDARPDLDVRCGWKRPTRTSIGGWCGRPQLKDYCM